MTVEVTKFVIDLPENLNMFDLVFHPRELWIMVPVAVSAGIGSFIVRLGIVLMFSITD